MFYKSLIIITKKKPMIHKIKRKESQYNTTNKSLKKEERDKGIIKQKTINKTQ